MPYPVTIAWFLALSCAANFAIAETTLQFPDDSIGEVSSHEASTIDFGYSLDSSAWSGWELIGPAQGAVTIPEGHVASLRLNRRGASDTSWVNAVEPSALTQLLASQTELDDSAFARISRLSGLRHLDVGSNELTSDIAESLARFHNLQYLWLSYMPEVDDNLMPAVAALPQLEQVGLWTTAITDEGLTELAKSRSLRAVYAGRTQITDKGVAALMKMPTLKAVRLNSLPKEFRQEGQQYPDLTDGVVDALRGRPELELLDLSGAQISDEGFARLAKSLKRLRRLVIDHTPISRKGLQHLRGFENLEKLRCYQLEWDDSGSRFDDSVAISLVGMKSLKSITGDVDLTDKGVTALAKLPSLETLGMAGRGVTDASMPSVAAMRSLSDLSLQHTRVTDSGFGLLEGSSTIRRVQITGNRMTTRCVETLATMPNLKRVGMMTVDPRVDGKPTWQGIETLTELEEELWLYDCPKLSGDDISAVARLKDLKNLRIEGGGALSDNEVIRLASCEQLEQLTLTSTVATDHALAAIARLPKLRSLVLSCVATNKGLQELAESTSLRRLSVASPNMTDEAFDSVRNSATHLESMRRGDFRIADNQVSKSQSTSDEFWRLGTLEERKELNELEGNSAPEIAASRWMNGTDQLSLSDLLGKVVLIDFWGSWCGPCVSQLPEIRRLRDEYADRDLVVLGIHSTQGAADGEQYAERNHLDWPIAIDDSKQTATAYRVPGWPSLYLIDKKGTVRLARPLPDDLDAAIQLLLDE